MPEFHGANPTLIADTGQSNLFAFVRKAPTNAVVCIYNFTEFWTALSADWARAQGASQFTDGLSDAVRRPSRRPHPAAALCAAVAALKRSPLTATASPRRRSRKERSRAAWSWIWPAIITSSAR